MDSVEAAERAKMDAERRAKLVLWWSDRRKVIRACLDGKKAADVGLPVCSFQNIVLAAKRRGVLVKTEQEIK
jgi:hypothetical protein